jgi:hypothetical protein
METPFPISRTVSNLVTKGEEGHTFPALQLWVAGIRAEPVGSLLLYISSHPTTSIILLPSSPNNQLLMDG